MQERPVLDFPGPKESIPAATEFRSTWIASSLEGLRAHGHYDAYLARLDARCRNDILDSVAGAWLPIAVVRAHYVACEALALSPNQIARMAEDSGSVRRAWHANIIAAAQRPEMDIWTILQQLQKLWLRSANGGATAAFQLGPHRARVEYVGCELFSIPYFRRAVSSVLAILGGHLCPDLRVTEIASSSHGANYILEWRSA